MTPEDRRILAIARIRQRCFDNATDATFGNLTWREAMNEQDTALRTLGIMPEVLSDPDEPQEIGS